MMGVWTIHGLLGATAVFIVFPLGILIRRIKIKTPWLSHTFIQCVGIAITLAGAGIGLSKSQSFHDMHQYSGVILLLILYSQLLVGLIVRDTQSDTGIKLYLQMYHIISGCTSLGVGWFTATTGLLLASWSSNAVIIIGLLTAVEIAAIPVICWYTRSRVGYTPLDGGPETRMSSDQDEDSSEDGKEKDFGSFEDAH